MEREQLIKEISDLAEKIKINASADANLLFEDATLLYEKVILLKHLPEEIKTNGAVEKFEEKKIKDEEKVQVPMDLFSSEETPKPTIKKSDKSVAEKLSHKKISDLKSVIGINEKFQFINELFDGNMKEYTVALDQINNFSSLSETENYLANLKEVYKWDSENSIAKQFTELVERKFV